MIPDVHLKPWIFEKAEEIVSAGQYDRIVILGDLADDWGKQLYTEAYRETYDAVISFIRRHPESLFCYGNHDISYFWEAVESGYSRVARDTAVEGYNRMVKELGSDKCAFVHMIDKVIFSQAGITESFVERCFGLSGSISEYDLVYVIKQINRMGQEELWRDDSPIWARPEGRRRFCLSEGFRQVVGHTPVKEPVEYGNLLVVDTFSTYSDGRPIGDESFVCIDTNDGKWQKETGR